ncbi:MAG: GIY-YIG nuclease family protein [Opitutales bacterium]
MSKAHLWRDVSPQSGLGGELNDPGSRAMFYVYILKSENNPERFYVGFTADLKARFADHNAGRSVHTNKYRPRVLFWYSAFSGEKSARAFEKYLKTGSGRRFQNRHLNMDD